VALILKPKNAVFIVKLKLFVSIVFYGILLSLPLAKAAEWTVEGSINQAIVFNDNVRMTEAAKGSFSYRLRPEIQFSRRTETSGVTAKINYGLQRYLSIKELNQNSQQYKLSSFYSTPRSYWGLNMLFSIAPARNTAEQDSGDFASDAEKTTRSIAPSYTYQLTELDSLSISPSYSDTTYSSAQFNNSQNLAINLAWNRQWTERYSNSLSFFYSIYDSTGSQGVLSRDTNINNQGLNLSSSYQWSENLQHSSTIGIRMTDSKNTFANRIENHQGLGFLTDTTIRYQGENYWVNVKISRALTPSSQGQLNEQNRLSLTTNYDITAHLSADALVSYQTSESASSQLNTNSSRENILYQSAINWKMARDWSLSASYGYRQQNKGDEPTTHSNSLMLLINYHWQGLSLAR
jgi:hypothetical protein